VSLMPSTPIEKTTMPIYNQLKTAIFFLGIIFLAILMGGLNYGEQLSGLYTGAFMFSLLVLLSGTSLRSGVKKECLRKFRIMIETHAEMTFLTLLLCTLGITIGLFTVTAA
jgi:hypothetical protein